MPPKTVKYKESSGNVVFQGSDPGGKASLTPGPAPPLGKPASPVSRGGAYMGAVAPAASAGAIGDFEATSEVSSANRPSSSPPPSSDVPPSYDTLRSFPGSGKIEAQKASSNAKEPLKTRFEYPALASRAIRSATLPVLPLLHKPGTAGEAEQLRAMGRPFPTTLLSEPCDEEDYFVDDDDADDADSKA